jgi:hypothetical protein
MRCVKCWRGIVAGAVTAVIVSAAPAAAQTWVGSLSGTQEVPPNGSPATGFATIKLNNTMLSVNVVFSGLMSPTNVAHIHCCVAPTGTAGVATYPGTFPGWPAGVTAASYSTVYDLALNSSWNTVFLTNNGGTPASAQAALVAGLNTGRAYFNIHTTGFTAGEIRGQLNTVVPEPLSVVLLGSGLAGIALLRRRRRSALPD